LNTQFNITITQEAADIIKETMADNNYLNGYLEIAVVGGGCSGLKYQMGLSEYEELSLDDVVTEDKDIKILTRKQSVKYLNGAVVDYTTNGAIIGFKIDNPNAAKSCGCGESFSIDGEQYDTCGGCGYK
jgi:iron-sulfur cluster assembly accessory protein